MGDSMMLMPAVSALLASPSDSAFAARWVVMSDEEQAVSIPMHGPAPQHHGCGDDDLPTHLQPLHRDS